MANPITADTLQTLNVSHLLAHGLPETRTITRDSAETISIATADQVQQLAFSPSGKRLTTGGKIVKIWEVVTGNPLAALPPYDDRLIQLRFVTEDQLLVAWAGRVAVWNLASERSLNRNLFMMIVNF